MTAANHLSVVPEFDISRFILPDGSIDVDSLSNATKEELAAVGMYIRQGQPTPIALEQPAVREATFRAHLMTVGLAPKTINMYTSRLGMAILWFAEHGGDLATAGAAELKEWSDAFPFSEPSRRQCRQALRHFYEWIGRKDPPLKAIVVPKKPRYMCRALHPSDASRLAAAAKAWPRGKPQGLVVLVGLYLALRAAEIAMMRWDRFDAKLEWYTVTGKNNDTATIPVHPTLRAELEHYKTPYVYLFPGGQGRAHVDGRTVLAWVKEVGRDIGIDDIFTHQLRHTALATANDRLGDLRAVSQFARHKNVETTMLYTRTTAVKLQAVMEAIDY